MKDHNAARLYAAGTKWCTSKRPMFDLYNQDGPLYFIHDKKSNKKYQLHLPSKQFMDELDRHEDLKEFADRFPQLKKIDHWKNDAKANLSFGQHLLEPHEKDKIVDKIINSGTVDEKKILGYYLPETLDRLVKDKNPEVRKNIIRNAPNHILDTLSKDPSDSVRARVAQISLRHAEQLLDDPSINVRKQIIDNHDKYIQHYMNGDNKELRSYAIEKQLRSDDSKISDEIAKEHITPHNLVNFYHKLSPSMKTKALDSITSESPLYDIPEIKAEDIAKRVIKTNHPSIEHFINHRPTDLSRITSNISILKKIVDKNTGDPWNLSFGIKALIKADNKNAQEHINKHYGNFSDKGSMRNSGIPLRTNNPDHHLDLVQNQFYHKDLIRNPHVSESIKKGMVKQALNNGDDWIYQKAHVLPYITNSEDIDKMWKNRHNTKGFLIKNQKFVHAIHDHPYVSAATKDAAAKTIEKYRPGNEKFAERPKTPRRPSWRQLSLRRLRDEE